MEALLGKPDKAFKVVTKEIYQYKDGHICKRQLTDAQ